MQKTLLLHIGHYKTGTTALQIFFSQAGKFLKRHGIEYPDICTHNAKHSALAFAILRAAGVEKLMYDYRDPTPPAALWAPLYERAMSSPAATILISSEEFMRIGEFPKAQEILRAVIGQRPEGLDVKAIAYLRPPQAHLHSWFNQLVKMNFPMPDFETALGDEIERIHYDYRRAFAPWIDILGPDNVTVRPYVKDRARPDALHRDFLATLGVDLPEGEVKLETDPNPRLDDRVVDLVRLMQNIGYPRPTVNSVRTQAEKYLQAEDALTPPRVRAETLAAVRTATRAGLEWLGTQSSASVPVEDYAQALPEGPPAALREANLVTGFVLSELIQLRQRVNRMNLGEIEARLAALEAQLSVKPDA